jgi:tetratricopeptide (TPR) repeat protein
VRDDTLHRLALAALLLTAAAVYAPMVRGGFVWDDHPLVEANLLTGSLANLPRFFQVDLWQTAGGAVSDSGYYRPLMLLSLAIDRALWGLSPAGHHLHSVAWHVAAVGALYAVLHQLKPGWPALAGAALFALHPVQSEAVAWVVARNDLMAAAFSLAAVAALLPKELSNGRLALGGVLALCGLLSKESAVFAGALLLALELARHGRPQGFKRYAVLGGALAIWFGLRTSAQIVSASIPGPDHRALLLDRLPELVAHYGLRLVWPDPLTVGSTLEYLTPSAAWIALGVACLVVPAGLLVWRGGKTALAGLGFALLAMAPAVVAIAVRGQMGERYLYLPLAGVAVALAAALPDRRAVGAGLVPLAAMSCWLISARLPDWRSDLSLWEAALHVEDSGFTQASVAFELASAGRRDLATHHFHEALRDDPPYVHVCVNALQAPLKEGLLEQAAQGAELVSQVCAPTPELAGLQGLIYLQVGELERAAQVSEPFAGAVDPRLPLVEGALAVLNQDQAAYDRVLARSQDPAAFEQTLQRLLAQIPR